MDRTVSPGVHPRIVEGSTAFPARFPGQITVVVTGAGARAPPAHGRAAAVDAAFREVGSSAIRRRFSPHSQASDPNFLLVGESWIKHTVHLKGFDQFTSTEYAEGGGEFLSALAASGYVYDYIRGHEVSSRFPTSLEQLQQYDVIVLSDIGANSFLLTDEVFLRSEVSVNRLGLIVDYVRAGGGLIMVGGYMSFSGIDGRARFGMSPLADVLPVTMLPYDDRVEAPEGLTPRVDVPEHPVLGGTPLQWPRLLGYNRLTAKPDSTVVVSHGSDPLLVLGTAGDGLTVAFASDFAPHWAPPEFVSWKHYAQLWSSIVGWAGGTGSPPAGSRRSPDRAAD